MKQLTPMQELELKLSAAISDTIGGEYAIGMKNAYEIVLTDIQSFMLEKEKQVIIDAFVQGNKEVFYDGTEEVMANAYYNNKYTKQ